MCLRVARELESIFKPRELRFHSSGCLQTFKGFIETFPQSSGRLVFSAQVEKNIIPLPLEAAEASDTSVYFHGESERCSCSNTLESAGSSLIFQVQEGTLVRVAYHDETSSPKPSQSRILSMDEYTEDME